MAAIDYICRRMNDGAGMLPLNTKELKCQRKTTRSIAQGRANEHPIPYSVELIPEKLFFPLQSLSIGFDSVPGIVRAPGRASSNGTIDRQL